MFCASAVSELLDLLLHQLRRALRFEIRFNLGASFLERRRRRRFDVRHLKYRVAVRCRGLLRGRVGLRVEDRFYQFRSRSDAGKRIGTRDHAAGLDLQSVRLGCLVETLRASLRVDGAGKRLSSAGSFLTLELRFDLGFHFVEALQVSVVPIFHLDDVEAVAALHKTAHLARLQAECGFLEFGYGATAANPSEFTTLGGATRIVGILSSRGQRNSRRLAASSKRLPLSPWQHRRLSGQPCHPVREAES